MNLATISLLLVYAISAALLMTYGLNCYVLILLFHRRRKTAKHERRRLMDLFPPFRDRSDLPLVTTQIPLYNEMNVAERVMTAAARMDYPAGRHEIQVLDDSSDETRELVDRAAEQLRGAGVDIRVIRRKDRTGSKPVPWPTV